MRLFFSAKSKPSTSTSTSTSSCISRNPNSTHAQAAAAASPSLAPPPPTPAAAVETSSSSSSSQYDTPRSRSAALSQSTSISTTTTATSTTIIDLTTQYTIALQTSSYTEIWNKLHQFPASPPPPPSSPHLLIDQILHPNHHSIHQALQSIPPNKLTGLVSSYFDSSEHTCQLFLLLQRSIDTARHIYAPLHDLLQILTPDSPTFSSYSQLHCAFSALSDFDRHDNPFPSIANFHDMRRCFSDLKLQLERRLRKARRRLLIARRATCCCAFCIIGTTVGVVVTAVVVATHFLAAIFAAPFFTFLPTARFASQQLEHIAQLDAAARGTYVLDNDLATIDRLVARLHATVESDKLLVRRGLQQGEEMYPIQEVLKQLRKDQPNFLHQLKDLEEHVCLCFAAVNRARSLLLHQIYLHQTHTAHPSPHFCLRYCTSSDSSSSASDD